jgi:hypothetical protein
MDDEAHDVIIPKGCDARGASEEPASGERAQSAPAGAVDYQR